MVCPWEGHFLGYDIFFYIASNSAGSLIEHDK